MGREQSGITRREFLRQGTALGIGSLAGVGLPRGVWATSKDRIMILNSSVTDSLNLYNHSSSPIYGMWQHIFEPLVEVAYNPVGYTGILAESWEFQGKKRAPVLCARPICREVRERDSSV